MTEKDYYEDDNLSMRRMPYCYILPCLIIHKEECPAEGYKGWGIHVGILCFAIDFNW
jgi:hypothetical protein